MSGLLVWDGCPWVVLGGRGGTPKVALAGTPMVALAGKGRTIGVYWLEGVQNLVLCWLGRLGPLGFMVGYRNYIWV